MSTSRRAWLMWALAVTAYCIAVFHRASLGVAGPQAQQRFGATAAVLSLFVVLQLGVYAALQVPVGVILDRVGSRRLIAAGAAVMGAGQILLAEAHSIPAAVLARVLVGAGDAMTFTSVLRLVPAWFPPRHVPVVTQLSGLLGQGGQLAAAVPLVALLHGAGWTPAFLGAGLTGMAIAALVAAALRDAPAGTVRERPAGVAEARFHLVEAWREPGTRLGLWTHFTTQFSGTVFALLWGYPFLVQGEGRTPQEAAMMLTILVLAALGIGPVVGQIAGRWPYRRSVPTLTVVGASAAAWTLVLAWPGPAPLAVLVLLVLVLATNGPGSMLGFDYARTENEPVRLGSATGIVNVGGFVASLSTTLLIGLLLDLSRPGGGDYTLGDFRLALAVQYVVWAIGLAGLLTARRRLRALRAPDLDPFPRAVVRVARDRRERRRESSYD
jgi:MFS family permease